MDDTGRGPAPGSPAEGRRNLTDPGSRITKTRTGWIQCFNAELLVSSDAEGPERPIALGTRREHATAAQSWRAVMRLDHPVGHRACEVSLRHDARGAGHRQRMPLHRSFEVPPGCCSWCTSEPNRLRRQTHHGPHRMNP
ncbi:MAG: hypothetical protein QOE71_3452, partial [Pseudonocardiales bacterium]|nr:hypothetical protein [Pseudonocardiales bacterium]